MNTKEQIEKLKQIIPDYITNNTECNAIKKLVSKGSTEIKDIMTSLKIDTFDEIDGYTVSITHVDKSYMDMDKLLMFVKSNFPKELQERVIKTREYIDEDALENIMYKNEIDDDTKANMAKCMVEKEELRLNIKKAKEGKENDD